MAFIIGGAIANALAFSGSIFCSVVWPKKLIEKERKRQDKAIKDIQRAQIYRIE